MKKHILELLAAIPDFVSIIYLVDDACPEGSGKYVEEHCLDKRCRVMHHERNQGVGGAMVTGFNAALESDCDIFVKMDGDGQMDPGYLESLISPIVAKEADYTKGNRFFDMAALSLMPLVRRIGNMGLTLLAKGASGYWNLSDPTNGYVAIHRSALELIDRSKLEKRYFFECDILIRLNVIRATACEIPIPAVYGTESSSLSVFSSLIVFPIKLLRGFFRRVIWRYFIYDMSAVTVFLVVGSVLCFGGIGFGLYRWYEGHFNGATQTVGTVALGLFPSIIGFQMLLQAMILDIIEKPLRPIQTVRKLFHS
ncbi:glycosyltransferase family 2 protein [Puniceicoccaceae bacterium K14]|nr:glycosyltransferase family 2 protein [Puniceicoccaceae bacterium K14]